jgi:hypothetical protein
MHDYLVGVKTEKIKKTLRFTERRIGMGAPPPSVTSQVTPRFGGAFETSGTTLLRTWRNIQKN